MRDLQLLRQPVARSLFARRSGGPTPPHVRMVRSMGWWHVMTIISVCAGTAALAWGAGHFLFTWERLRISEFRLKNPPQLQRQQVNAVLQHFGGNILALDSAALRAALCRNGEVADVSITRLLPQTVEIAFTLRKPWLQLRSETGYALYDSAGVLLASVSQPLPEVLLLENETPADIPALVAQREEIERLRPRLLAMSYRQPYGLALRLKGLDEIIYPGSGSLSDKIDRYLALRPELAASGPLAYADLRFPDRLYVGYTETPENPDEK